MAWTSQGTFQLNLPTGYRFVHGFGETGIYFGIPGLSTGNLYRFTISGTTPTRDTALNFQESFSGRSYALIEGFTLRYYDTSANWRIFFRDSASRFLGRPNKSLTGEPRLFVNQTNTLAATGTRVYYLDSDTAPTRIIVYSGVFNSAAGATAVARVSGEEITFTGHTYARSRVITDGTTIWLMGVSSNGLTVTGTAWTISTRARDTSKDFSATFTTAQQDVAFDGSSIYVLPANPNVANAVTKYSFVEATAAPTGSVSAQTATAGSSFSLNLADSISGRPAPTFTVRNNSLNGTGLSLSGTTISGTPTRSNARASAYTVQIRATNSQGTHDFQFSLTIRSAPQISAIPNQTATAGVAYSLNLATYLSGFPTPTIVSVSNRPSWLSLSGTTLSGTPSAAASSRTMTVTARNAVGTVTRNFSLTVSASLSAPSGSVPSQTATAGTSFSLNLASHITGNPAPTFSVRSNSLNGTGLSLSGTTISGTPARSNARATAYTVQLTATNSQGTHNFSVSLTIRSTPQISAIPNQTAVAGAAFSLNLATYISGIPTPSVTVANRPSWLGLSGTTLSGTPPSAASAEKLTVTARNAAGTATADFEITVSSGPERPSGTVPSQTATAGTAFSLNLASHITGTPAPTFSVRNNSLTGTGLSLSGTTISGTPTRSQARVAVYILQLRATNSQGSWDFSVRLNINAAPQLSDIPNQVLRVNRLFSLNLATYVSGIPAPTITVSNRPSWMSISGTTISGTPTRSAGATTLTVTARNAAGTATKTFTVEVAAQIATSGWTSQGTFGITGVATGWRSAPSYGGGADYLYYWIARDQILRRWTISGTTATEDLPWGVSAGDNRFALSGNTGIWMLGSAWLTTSLTTRGLSGFGTITGEPSGLTANQTSTFCITNNRVYYLDSSTAPSRIHVYSYTATTVTRQTSEEITFTALSYARSRLITDGTTLWLFGVSSDGLTVTGTAWTISTRARDRAKDFSETFSVAQHDVNYDGAHFYVAPVSAEGASAITKFRFRQPSNATPRGSVTPQTATAGSMFSLDLSDSIVGFPLPSFTVRNNSLAGTGLVLSGTTISGTPARSNARVTAYTVQLTATNSQGSYNFDFTLTIRSLPQIASIPNQNARIGIAFSLDLSRYLSGIPTPTIAVANRPSWLSLSGTTITGTPTAAEGARTLTVTATNAAGSTIRRFAITVAATSTAPTGTVPAQTAVAGTLFSLNLAVHVLGFPNPTFSVRSNSLDGTGLSLSGTTLSGTPTRTQARAAAYTLLFTATNTQGTHDFSVSLTIQSAPQISQIPAQTAYQNSAFTLNLATYLSGIPAPTIAVANRPSWLSLSGTTLSGTPTATAPLRTLTVTATNAVGSISDTFTLAVSQPRTAPTGTVPDQETTALFPYRYDLDTRVTGRPEPVFTVRNDAQGNSSLAGTGITLLGGVLSGTPTNAQTGTHTILLRATNAAGTHDFSFDLVIHRMAWESQGAFALDLAPGYKPIPAHNPNPVYLFFENGLSQGVLLYRRYTITGITPTVDAAWRNAASDTFSMSLSGNVVLRVERNTVGANWFTAALTSRGLGSFADLTGGRAFASADLADAVCFTGTRAYTVNSTVLPRTINVYSIPTHPANSPNVREVVAERITVTADGGAGFNQRFARVRLITDGTTIWLVGITTNGLAVQAYAYTLSTRLRDHSKDFTGTFTTAIQHVNFDGTHFYTLPANPNVDSAVSKFRFTPQIAPSGTIAAQTANPGAAYSLDLSDHISGAPLPTYSVRNRPNGVNSLTGTGLTLSGSVLSGTPAIANLGAHDVLLTATNVQGTHNFGFVFTVARSTPTGTVPNQHVNGGVAFSLDLSTLITGNPAPTFTVRNRPDGMSSLTGSGLSLSGSTLSGTPTIAQGGEYQILMRASNTSGTHDFEFTFTVRTAPVWTMIPDQEAVRNVRYALDLADYISGLPAPTFTELNNSFPDWLTLSGTEISGTPTAVADSEKVTVRATNAVGSADTTFELAVLATSTTPTGTVADQTAYTNVAFSLDLSDHITGSEPITFTEVASSLPAWLTLSGTMLTGSPTTAAAATRIQLRASNAQGTLDIGFDLTVEESQLPAWITIPTQVAYHSPSAQTQYAYSLDLSDFVSGNPEPVITALTTLPSWLSLSGTTLSGNTPTTLQAAVTLQFRATNSRGTTDSEMFQLRVDTGAQPSINSAQMAAFRQNNTFYTGRMANLLLNQFFGGTPPITFTYQITRIVTTSATRRRWVVFRMDADGNTYLTGTPPETPAATVSILYEWTITATNLYGTTSFDTTLRVDPSLAPEFTTNRLTRAVLVGTTFDLDISDFILQRGIPRANVMLTESGQQAITERFPFLTFDGNTLSGTPSANDYAQDLMGDIGFVMRSERHSDGMTLTLWVLTSPPTAGSVADIPTQTAYRNIPFSFDVSSFIRGSPPATATATTLPTSLRFTRDNVVTGTFTEPSDIAASPHAVTIQATNYLGSGSETFQINVLASTAPTLVSGAVITVTSEFIGRAFTYDVEPLFTRGAPAGEITFEVGYQKPGWLDLQVTETTAVLSGTFPDTGQDVSASVRVPLIAMNALGTVSLSVLFRFQVPPQARWRRTTLPNSASGFPYLVDLADYVTGTPTPTISVAQGKELPSNMTLTGTILRSTALPIVGQSTDYQVDLTATNTVDGTIHSDDVSLVFNVLPIGQYAVDYLPVRSVVNLGTTNFSTGFNVNETTYNSITVIREVVNPDTSQGDLIQRTSGGVYLARGFEFLSGPLNEGIDTEEGIVRFNRDGVNLGASDYHEASGLRIDLNPYSLTDNSFILNDAGELVDNPNPNLYVRVLRGQITRGGDVGSPFPFVQRFPASEYGLVNTINPRFFVRTSPSASLVIWARDKFYVVNPSSGEADSVTENQMVDRDAHIIFTGLSGPMTDLAFDEVTNEYIVADSRASLFRRYDIEGNPTGRTYRYADLLDAGVPDNAEAAEVRSIACDDGDIYILYHHSHDISVGLPRWTQRWGVIERRDVYFKQVPPQILDADNNHIAEVDLRNYVHDDAVLSFAPGFTPPDGMTLVGAVWKYEPPIQGRMATHTVYLRAQRGSRYAFGSFLTSGSAVAPTWQEIPDTASIAGVYLSVPLNAFVSGLPNPRIEFADGYDAPDWMSITDGVLFGIPSLSLYRTAGNAERNVTEVVVQLKATNTEGTATQTVQLDIAPGANRLAPTWSNIPTQQGIASVLFTFDVTDYLTGFPAPTVAFGDDAPEWLSITGNVISGTPRTRDFLSDRVVNVPLVASNEIGTTQTILRISVLRSGQLIFLEQIPETTLDYPDEVTPHAMTATSTRIYIAATGRRGISGFSSGRMLVYDWEGVAQDDEEFVLPGLDGTSSGYSGMERVGERLYLLEADYGILPGAPGATTEYVGVVHSYSLTGEAGANFYVPHTTVPIDLPPAPSPNPPRPPPFFYRARNPIGLAYEAPLFYVGTRLSGRGTWRMATFEESGLQGPIVNEIILPSFVQMRGIAESDTHFYILGGGDRGINVGRYNKQFIYQRGFDIQLHPDNDDPIAIAHGDGRIAVLDLRRGLFIYGTPTTPTVRIEDVEPPRPPVRPRPEFPYTPTIIVLPGVTPELTVGRVRQFEGLDDWVSYLDILRPTGTNTFQVLALGVEAIVQSTVSPQHFVLAADVEITALLHEVTIIPRYPIEGLRNEDRIYPFTGTRSAVNAVATGNHWTVQGVTQVAEGRHQEIYAEFASV